MAVVTSLEKMTTMLTGHDLGAGSSPPSRIDTNMQELAEEPEAKISVSTLPQLEKTINMIMRLRPGTKVSALDFASFQMTVYKNHDRLRKHITTIEKMTTMLTGSVVPQGVQITSGQENIL